MEKVNCNICGKNTETIIWAEGRSKRFEDDKREYTIVKCSECGLIYTNPRLTKKELADYYGKSYVTNRGTNTEANKKRAKMYDIEVGQIKQVMNDHFGDKTVKFLDVGCSTGAFLKAMPVKGFEKYATDFTKAPVETAKKNVKLKKAWIGDIIDINFGKEKFDVVHLRAVFEHVLDPVAILKKCHKILNKNGILLLSTTPNAGSLAAKLYRYRWTLTKPEEHTYYYTNKTINKLFDMTNFKRFKTVYPYLGTPYCNLLTDHLKFVWNLLAEKECPSFWRSAFSIYAVKK